MTLFDPSDDHRHDIAAEAIPLALQIRNTIRQHYPARSHSDIAAQYGVSVDTVRTEHRRLMNLRQLTGRHRLLTHPLSEEML